MKVSIITATYNSAATVEDTLRSVASQTYNNIEHVIIDGISKDNTLDIVKKYPHVSQVISEKDKGIYDAMNKGIANVTGDIIAILNSDDFYENENVIAGVVNTFEKNPECGLVYGNISYFEGDNYDVKQRIWRTKSYYPTFFEDGEVPPHPALFVKKEVYEQVGCFNIEYKIAADHDFMFRALKIKHVQSFFLDAFLVKMRLGGMSTNGLQSIITSTQELITVWQSHGFNYPKRLYVLRPIKKVWQIMKGKLKI
jgi:glycosyltransferase involved in cell wall biosynthesis